MERPRADCSGPAMRMLFSVRQAVTQASQPVQRSRSTAIPHRCVMASPSLIQKGEILKLDESCTLNPKSEIANWTVQFTILKFRDLRCRICPISKFSHFYRCGCSGG